MIPARGFPWRDWLILAAGVFRLPPAAFWELTLAEWRWLMAGNPSLAAPLSRGELANLISNHPDKET